MEFILGYTTGALTMLTYFCITRKKVSAEKTVKKCKQHVYTLQGIKAVPNTFYGKTHYGHFKCVNCGNEKLDEV